jgi:RNA methyltransferase, TrmH family
MKKIQAISFFRLFNNKGTMISKNNIKLIKSLTDVKKRKLSGLFVVEGEKMVRELLVSNFGVQQIFATEKWLAENPEHSKLSQSVSSEELIRISQQKTPNQVLALAELPGYHLNLNKLKNQLCLVLDDLQDPGNLGTIIRICNWFGVEHVICSLNTADSFNPKVVQSSMGGIFRVKIYYQDLAVFLNEYKIVCKHPVAGTFLKGESVYDTPYKKHGLLVLGNESKGISEPIAALVDQKITIPSFPESNVDMDSLNVAIASAIIISEFRRREIS